MNPATFDRNVRALSTPLTRRGMLGLLAAGALTIAGLDVSLETAAGRKKRRKKGKKKKKKPVSTSTTCPPTCPECQACSNGACQPLADGTACSGAKVCEGGACVPLRCGNGGPCTVFTTALTHDPAALGGVAGADAVCASTASEAGLSGTFRAWLSSSESSPTTRFTNTDKAGPYRLVRDAETDGDNPPPTVAASFTDLVTCNLPGSDCLQHAIDRTQRGGIVRQGTRVWTGTLSTGVSAPDTCGGFTARETGVIGNFLEATSAWTNAEVITCFGPGHLYCFEQA